MKRINMIVSKLSLIREYGFRQEEADDLTAKYIQRKQYLEQHMNEKVSLM